MKKLQIIFITILVIVEIGMAQKQNNIWYFGDEAGLDFNTDPPSPITGSLYTLEGSASISDPDGHLLFYTDGFWVWDRNHNVMSNGIGLMGGYSSTQSALIVLQPNTCNKYYLFAAQDAYEDGGLSYSIVDMFLNDGLGDIDSASKNMLIVDHTSEKISAVRHADGIDFWIITHTLNSSEFLAYLLSETGLSTQPVISSIGSVYPSTAFSGPIVASHRGTKLVSSATQFNICEIFDFDPATGKLSNFQSLNPLFSGQQSIYGIEFSPNDSLLYLSTTDSTNFLYQVDLASNQIITLNAITGGHYLGALQLGPDKKIYIARKKSSKLDVIEQPDLLGLACQYVEGGQVLLDSTQSEYGLTSFAPFSLSQVLSLGSLSVQKSEINFFAVEPNPFQSTANIRFNLAPGGKTLIKFYDATGRIIHLIDKVYSPGEHIEQIRNNELKSGDGLIYCQLICNGDAKIVRVIKL